MMRRVDGVGAIPTSIYDRSGAAPLHAQQDWNLAGRANPAVRARYVRGSLRCGRCCRYTVPSKTFGTVITFAQQVTRQPVDACLPAGGALARDLKDILVQEPEWAWGSGRDTGDPAT